MAKFALIGVGSAVFGARTIGDLFLLRDRLGPTTISLVDPDTERLALVETMAKKLNAKYGEPFSIESSAQRDAALDGADFVVTSPAFEREKRWKIDWEIISAAGIKQTYGENGGPGSLSHTLRNVPVLLSIARDVEARCPDAWVINYTNPESRICMALDRYTDVKFIGLCHQIWEGYKLIAEITGVDTDDLDIKAAGLNHFTFMYSIHRRSTAEDLYPYVRQHYRRVLGEKQPLSCRMMDLFGMFPTSGDHHLAEMLSFGWEYLGLHGRDWRWWADFKQQYLDWIVGVRDGTRPLEDMIDGFSGERVAQMAVALLNNDNSYEISMDIRNNGAIPNLPDDVIVEVPGVISAFGATPLRMPPLPEPIAGLMRKQIAVQELSVDAAVTGDRRTALQALALDPVVDNVSVAESVLDRILDAHRDLVHSGFFGG